MPSARAAVTGLVTGLLASLALTGCGSDDAPAADSSPSASSSATPSGSASPSGSATPAPETTPAEPRGTVIDITFEGDSVKPDGVERKARAGEPITLRITADAPGELHVHSDPEQEIEYAAGTSRKKLTIERPGVVDVESHDLDRLIVQLEVR